MTDPSPPPEVVNRFHAQADRDTSTTALHHTLGIGANQATAGTHNHNGQNSKRLGEGFNLAFPTTANAAYTQAQLQAVIDALRFLGFGS